MCRLYFLWACRNTVWCSVRTLCLAFVSPYKPSVLSVGHMQTVQTQIRRYRTWHLFCGFTSIRLKNVLLEFWIKMKKKSYYGNTGWYIVDGGGWVLWYFHTYEGSGHFLGLKILNFNILLGFSEKQYFWGYEDFVDIFGSSLNLTIFSGHFYAF